MRPTSHLGERVVEVGDEVLDILTADRDPDQPVADAGGDAVFARHCRVGHRRRVLDEGFDTAQEALDRIAELIEKA